MSTPRSIRYRLRIMPPGSRYAFMAIITWSDGYETVGYSDAPWIAEAVARSARFPSDPSSSALDLGPPIRGVIVH